MEVSSRCLLWDSGWAMGRFFTLGLDVETFAMGRFFFYHIGGLFCFCWRGLLFLVVVLF